MRRIAIALGTAALATLALTACGHSDNANAPASADNVEMPAEEALSGVAATPAADPSAATTDAATSDAPASATAVASAAADAASSAASGPASSPTSSKTN